MNVGTGAPNGASKHVYVVPALAIAGAGGLGTVAASKLQQHSDKLRASSEEALKVAKSGWRVGDTGVGESYTAFAKREAASSGRFGRAATMAAFAGVTLIATGLMTLGLGSMGED